MNQFGGMAHRPSATFMFWLSRHLLVSLILACVLVTFNITAAAQATDAAHLKAYEGRYEMNPTRLGNFTIDVEAQTDRLLLRFSHRQQQRFVPTTKPDDFVDAATKRIHLDFTRDENGRVTALTLRDVSITYYFDSENNVTSRTVPGGADVSGKRVALPTPSATGNTTFRLKGYPQARIVTLAGSFNNWHQSRAVFEREADGWVCRIDLMPGTYTYKFIVDGTWITDPANSKTEADEFGNLNSVLVKEK